MTRGRNDHTELLRTRGARQQERRCRSCAACRRPIAPSMRTQSAAGVPLLGVTIRSAPALAALCRVSQGLAGLRRTRCWGGCPALGDASTADDECRDQDGDHSDTCHRQPKSAHGREGQYGVRFVDHECRVPRIITKPPIFKLYWWRTGGRWLLTVVCGPTVRVTPLPRRSANQPL